jgi:hypothetical protein
MVELRGMGQVASVDFRCPDSQVELILHAGEVLARMKSTTVYAGGFASIQVYDVKEKSLKSWGFDRPRLFLETVASREDELRACDQASMAFSAVTEGGCGDDAIDLVFSTDGRVTSVGAVRGGTCGR